jgi:hypothetical protein
LKALSGAFILLALACADEIAPIRAHAAACLNDAQCGEGLRCHRSVCLRIAAGCNHDGYRDPGEACDDGNLADDDACVGNCRVADCNDGFVRRDRVAGEPGFENCEPGAENGAGNCAADCRVRVKFPTLLAGQLGTCWLRNPGTLLCWGARQDRYDLEEATVGVWGLWSARIGRFYFLRNGAGIIRGMSVEAQVGTARVIPHSSVLDAEALTVTIGSTAIGGTTICSVNTHGEVVCNEPSGECGLAAPGERTELYERGLISGLPETVDIAISDRSICAVSLAGDTTCWGDTPTWGGSPVACARALPERLDWAGDSVAISATLQSYAALQSDGTVVQWGRTWDGFRALAHEVVDLPASAVALSSSVGTHCALLADATVACWGRARGVEAGAGAEARLVAGLPPIAEIAEGVDNRHLCARGLDNSIWCWGANDLGQLGDGSTEDRLTPVQADPPN